MFSDVAEGRLNVHGSGMWSNGETSFHMVLPMAARNEELLLDVRRLQLKLQRLIALAERAGTVVADPQHDHAEILNAVQRGDGTAARDLVDAHATAIEKAVMETLLSSDALQSVNLA